MRPGSKGEHELQQELGSVERAGRFYDVQMQDELNERMIDLLKRQEMMFISTADAKGECDCSFRAGPPGFAAVLNSKTIVFPELRGNGVYASLGNISENAHVGLLFMDFLQSTIGLHVNGRARMVSKDQLLKLPTLPESLRESIHSVGGRSPEAWVEVLVDEAYIHCSKHVPQLRKTEKTIDWGTDNETKKGGDYFGCKK